MRQRLERAYPLDGLGVGSDFLGSDRGNVMILYYIYRVQQSSYLELECDFLQDYEGVLRNEGIKDKFKTKVMEWLDAQ